MALKQTPSQTVGPYFAYGLTPQAYGYAFRSAADHVLVRNSTEGERMRVEGQVFDGQGEVVNDAMIEIWQANALGRYNHPADERQDNQGDPEFTGFGRCGTGADASRSYCFETVKPGSTEEGQAPHINVIVFMRGLLSHLYTRIYFSDEAAANAGDPVLAGVEAARRDTLIATRQEGHRGVIYRFDIHMQGEKETVFFDL